MNILAQILLTLGSIAYPLIWYFGREHGAFFWLALVMGLLWLIRGFVQKTRAQRVVSWLLAAFFAVILWFRQPETMYWYPVAVNLLMLAVFGSSLWAKQTVIERLARLQYPDLPPEGVRHTRRVTQIWCGFFIVNTTICLILLACACYEAWAMYTGIIAYIFMGILLAGEWLYRKIILKV